jgi:hypothetical protein
MIGYSVNGGRRDENEALDPTSKRSLQQDSGPCNVGRENFGWRAQRQRRRRVHHHPHIRHCPIDGLDIPDIAPDGVDSVSLRILEGRDVQGPYRVALRNQMTAQIDAEKSSATGYEINGSVHKLIRPSPGVFALIWIKYHDGKNVIRGRDSRLKYVKSRAIVPPLTCPISSDHG